MSVRYQPFYCEENAWWLCHDAGADAQAVFISNARKQCVLFQQRIAPPGEPAVWDYHVVAVIAGQVWDPDTRLGMPLPALSYLGATFPFRELADVRFRVVPRDALLATFTTDRSHMRTADGWREPPPPWDPPAAPGHGMNLLRFIDMDDPIAGEVLDLPALRARYSR